MIQWRFPSNNYGETKGINDSGVAMFRGTPLKSLAREICQNSLDAGKKKTVVVDFDLFYLPTQDIPGIDSLKDAFKRSLDFWKNSKGGSTRDFFGNAIKAIEKDKCPVLRISDYNTTGLTGSKEPINTDWVNLTKSAGASDKLGTAGGSFGIGKYAPFACSDFSTVFYSTYDINGEKACQGVSRLVTFEDANGETTQGTGYYGEEKNTPVYEELNLQPNYNRAADNYGTDIYIAGYKYDNGEWQSNIIVSILDSFLGAIWNEKLIVHVGKVELSKNTLPSIIEEYKNSLIDNTAYYYETLASAETKWIEHNFPGLGEVKYGVLLGNPDAPRKVAMIRKTGMKIKNKGGLSSSVPFSGVLFIEGEKLNQRLRAMENPEHNEWQPERVVTNPGAARALLSQLYAFLRDIIQELSYSGDGQEVDAAGAGAYLPDEDPDSPEQVKDEVVSDKVLDIDKKIKEAPKSKPKPEQPDLSEMDESEPDSENGEGVGRVTGGDQVGWVDGTEGHITNTGNGEQLTFTETAVPGNGTRLNMPIRKSIILKKFVPICIDKEKGIYVLVIEASEKYTNCELELFLSAETRGYEAPLLSADIPRGEKIKFTGNVLQGLNLEKDVPVRIKLVLDYNSLCSMEVKAYATEK